MNVHPSTYAELEKQAADRDAAVVRGDWPTARECRAAIAAVIRACAHDETTRAMLEALVIPAGAAKPQKRRRVRNVPVKFVDAATEVA